MRHQLKSADPVRQRRPSIPKVKSARADVSEMRQNVNSDNQKEKKSK